MKRNLRESFPRSSLEEDRKMLVRCDDVMRGEPVSESGTVEQRRKSNTLSVSDDAILFVPRQVRKTIPK